jgi:hypothetical protein
MANARRGNVQRVDTSAAFPQILNIKSIKYIGASNGTASVKADGVTGGEVIWEEAGTANTYNGDLCIRAAGGIYVTVTNSAVVYIYFK